ncbi:hypothetical protein ACV6RK_000421 [Cronobacter malonaticus]|nr:hypothetical protein [Cronobacter sakazakii]
MPVIVTFDLSGYGANDHGRIKTMFERYGWEDLGGTSYRYPKLGTTDQPVEDWLNHIVPALMLFRSYFANNPQVTLDRMSIDAHSSSGYNPDTQFGRGVLDGAEAASYEPGDPGKFGKKNIVDWLDNIPFPY